MGIAVVFLVSFGLNLAVAAVLGSIVFSALVGVAYRRGWIH
jgi:hypothetical protein